MCNRFCFLFEKRRLLFLDNVNIDTGTAVEIHEHQNELLRDALSPCPASFILKSEGASSFVGTCEGTSRSAEGYVTLVSKMATESIAEQTRSCDPTFSHEIKYDNRTTHRCHEVLNFSMFRYCELSSKLHTDSEFV